LNKFAGWLSTTLASVFIQNHEVWVIPTLQSFHIEQWGNRFISRKSVKWAALLTFVIWGCIIILGRLIAYDHICGHLSPATKA
jgi:hypothetical protein